MLCLERGYEHDVNTRVPGQSGRSGLDSYLDLEPRPTSLWGRGLLSGQNWDPTWTWNADIPSSIAEVHWAGRPGSHPDLGPRTICCVHLSSQLCLGCSPSQQAPFLLAYQFGGGHIPTPPCIHPCRHPSISVGGDRLQLPPWILKSTYSYKCYKKFFALEVYRKLHMHLSQTCLVQTSSVFIFL